MSAWRDLMRHLFRDRVAELLDAHDAERRAVTERLVKDAFDGYKRAENEALVINADCDHWEPCAYEDNWLCREHCGRCMPLSPCLGHDRVWAAIWNERAGVKKP